MKCYFISKENKENSVFISSEDCHIYEADCPEKKIEEGKALIQKWEIWKCEFWECVARSDNGIDDSRRDRYSYSINFNNLVFDGEMFIGIYLPEPRRILSFIDQAKQSIRIITSEEFVGGWGDISEGYSYCLSEKK